MLSTNATFTRVSTTVNDYFQVPEDVLAYKLVQDLAKAIEPFVSHSSHYDPSLHSYRHVASVNVATTDVQYAQIEAEGFYHRDHHFTSAQLRQALDNTFPELFL